MNPPTNEPTPTATDGTKVEANPITEPDWKGITFMLVDKIVHMTNYLRPPSGSSGMMYDTKTFESIHWREDLANTLEKVPGVKVDREALHAFDLPHAKRKKFFKERAEKKKAEAAAKALEVGGGDTNQPQG